MGFESLLGNGRIKSRLARSSAQGTLSHCYLLTGAEGSGKRTLARLLAAAMECTANPQEQAVPCCACPQCRKVLSAVHPDVITIDSEKKSIPVEQIRQMRADAFVRPNEGKKKVYLLPRAQDLLEPAQNALLKIIEEPPPYGVFVLMSTSRDRLLSTILSRAAELPLEPLDAQTLRQALQQRCPQAQEAAIEQAIARCGGALGKALELLETGAQPKEQTLAFASAFAAGSRLAILQVLAPMEKLERTVLAQLLQEFLELLTAALQVGEGLEPPSEEARQIGLQRTGTEIFAAIGQLREAQIWCSANVSSAHICGALAALL